FGLLLHLLLLDCFPSFRASEVYPHGALLKLLLKAPTAAVPTQKTKRIAFVDLVPKDCPNGRRRPLVHLLKPLPPLDCCFPETHLPDWVTKTDQPQEPAFGPLPIPAYLLVPPEPSASQPTVGWENQTLDQESLPP